MKLRQLLGCRDRDEIPFPVFLADLLQTFIASPRHRPIDRVRPPGCFFVAVVPFAFHLCRLQERDIDRPCRLLNRARQCAFRETYSIYCIRRIVYFGYHSKCFLQLLVLFCFAKKTEDVLPAIVGIGILPRMTARKRLRMKRRIKDFYFQFQSPILFMQFVVSIVYFVS